MEQKNRGIRGLAVAGGLIFCVGTLDPLEGSILVLLGCVLVTAGTRVRPHGKAAVFCWRWTLGLMAVGVAALWGLSALGGVGGRLFRDPAWARRSGAGTEESSFGGPEAGDALNCLCHYFICGSEGEV